VRSPGTAYVLLHHYMGEIDGSFRSWGLSRGGTGAVSNAIASAARELGAEIRTETPVARILTKGNRATGVVLANGDEIAADVVVSSVDPNLTFLQFMDPRQLPDEFVAGVRRYKFRGSSGKVNLALDALPDFTCKPGPGHHLRGAISISPSIDYMEQAYDDAKYGSFSRRPYMDIVRASRRRASTSCRASCSTRPITSRTAPGTSSARRLATRWWMRLPSTHRTSATSSGIGRC
jgi:phytoene dehydrogenase-like protein